MLNARPWSFYWEKVHKDTIQSKFVQISKPKQQHSWRYFKNYLHLAQIVEAIEAGETQKAKAQLKHFHPRGNRNEVMQYQLFAKALAKRIGDDYERQETNLYLCNEGISQIDLFDRFAQECPLIFLSRLIANSLLLNAIKDKEQVVLVDIGMGTGEQIGWVLQALAGLEKQPASLTVVGIEPSMASLTLSERRLTAIAQEHGLNVQFIPIARCIEQMDTVQWEMIGQLPGDLVLHEAFALHHIAGTGLEHQEPRDVVLSRLKALKPATFILTEPCVDHHTNNYLQRFYNCWQHFSAVFQVIDLLAMREDEKSAIKTVFFGREIEDILGHPDEKRLERHETAEMWVNRLYQAGFQAPLKMNFHATITHDWITVSHHRNYVTLDFNDEPLVAMMCMI